MYAHCIGGDSRCEKGIAALVSPEVQALKEKTIIIRHTFICTARHSSQSFRHRAFADRTIQTSFPLSDTKHHSSHCRTRIYYNSLLFGTDTYVCSVAVIHTTTVRPVFYSGRNNGISEEIRPTIKNETSFRITVSLKKTLSGQRRAEPKTV